MSSIKCPECNLTNWATAVVCKRCEHSLQVKEISAQFQPIQDSFDRQNFSNVNKDTIQQSFQTPNFELQTNSSPNFQYNQNHQHQNYQQLNHQYQQTVNLKSGLAIASMVLGILGFVTAIFLIGILIAPIGLVLGIVALIKTNKNPQIYGGKSFAIVGIVTSAIALLFVPIVAAIAIPNLLAARRAANEGSAISAIRLLHSAEKTYMVIADESECADLQALSSKGLIDPVLAKGEKSGYRFMIFSLPTVNSGCEIHATPLSSSTGSRSFYFSTEDNIIRGATKKGLPADKYDLPIDDSYKSNY
jgi:competence protein ComGC